MLPVLAAVRPLNTHPDMPKHPKSIDSRGTDDRRLARAFSRELSVISWHRDPVFEELYQSYTERISSARNACCRINDAVYFVLAAAASGVIGNFAYAAILAGIRRMRSIKGAKLAETFERVVELEGYDSIRIRIHTGTTPHVEIDAIQQRKLRKIVHHYQAIQALNISGP